MSDTPGGADWWQASDGKWYPPHTHPDHRPAPVPAPPQYPAPPYEQPAWQQPPYQQPTYQQSYSSYQPYGTPPQTSSKAVTVLILGIVSLVLCPVVPGIIAVVMAGAAMREIRESGGRYTGEGLVNAGRIISIISFVVYALGVMFFFVIVAFVGEVGDEFGEAFQDGLIQTDLEDALAAEEDFFDDHGRYTDDPGELHQYDELLTFAPGTQPFGTDVIVVQASEREVVMGSRSDSGTCFYVRDTLEQTGYAVDVACRDFSAQSFSGSW